MRDDDGTHRDGAVVGEALQVDVTRVLKQRNCGREACASVLPIMPRLSRCFRPPSDAFSVDLDGLSQQSAELLQGAAHAHLRRRRRDAEYVADLLMTELEEDSQYHHLP